MQGHSFTRRLNSDGKVNTVQTLHNLNEGDPFGFFFIGYKISFFLATLCFLLVTQFHSRIADELGSFEESWKGKAKQHLPGWDEGFNMNGGEGLAMYHFHSSLWMNMVFFYLPPYSKTGLGK